MAKQDELAADVSAAVYSSRDEAITEMAKAVRELVKSHRGQLPDPAAPRHVEEDSSEEDEAQANAEVERTRFAGAAHEPRDEEDELAMEAAAKRQKKVARKAREDEDEDEHERKSRKSRHEDEDEDEDEHERKSRKARHEDEEDEEEGRKSRKSRHVEGCMCDKCRSARKARSREDAATEAIAGSQKAYIYDEDWDDDDEDLHGYFEDPAEEKAEGDEGGDKVIITNMGRRMTSDADAREGKRRKKSRASERFYADLAKSAKAAAVIDASDEMNYLVSVLGAHLDRMESRLDKALGEIESMKKSQVAQSKVLVELAKSADATIVNPPMPGVFGPAASAMAKSRVADNQLPSIGKIRKALTDAVLRDAVPSDLAMEFEVVSEGGPAAVKEWLEASFDEDQRRALGL